jgi:cytochrome c553
VPEDAFYHVFEMNIDGSGRRQLTRGRYDDFDARYLPSGEIVFLSTRKGAFLQCTKANTATTMKADLPDSYVRCGGDNYRPVSVFTLHVMNADGENLRPISAFENFEWTPSVANDGRILYTRWDYIDRFNGHFYSLWSTNPDGTNPQLVYGNYTSRPQAVFEARAIPNSQKLICTAGAHHSNVGGSLILLDRSRGTEEAAPLVRLTPEVAFPETEAWADTYYANPYPLSEEYYLVAWSDRRLPPHGRFDDANQNPINATGLYLYDAFGNLNLIYRDPDISSECPVPVRPRVKPPVYSETVAWDGPQEGRLLLQNVYRGLGDVPRGTVKQLRIVAVPPKVQPQMNTPNLGVSSEDPGKYVLGTVPVEEDGSAWFRIPSGIPVFFQALDADGLAVQTMRTLTYVQPQQTLSCIGCHEARETAPAVDNYPLALSRQPSRLTPGPEGSWPLRFDILVQPVLDRNCVSCHGPARGDKPAARFDLTAAQSYRNLLSFGGNDLRNLSYERDRSVVGTSPARQSKLWSMLTAEKPHGGKRLDSESRRRLATWMDVYSQTQGHFSKEQEDQLRQLRRDSAALLTD